MTRQQVCSYNIGHPYSLQLNKICPVKLKNTCHCATMITILPATAAIYIVWKIIHAIACWQEVVQYHSKNSYTTTREYGKLCMHRSSSSIYHATT